MVTERGVKLDKFHVTKRHTINGERSVEEYELSYSEMLGYPATTLENLKFNATIIARTMTNSGDEGFGFADTHRHVVQALLKADQGDFSDLERLLIDSSAFPDEDVRYITSWPQARTINRLMRHIHRHGDTTFENKTSLYKYLSF